MDTGKEKQKNDKKRKGRESERGKYVVSEKQVVGKEEKKSDERSIKAEAGQGRETEGE